MQTGTRFAFRSPMSPSKKSAPKSIRKKHSSAFLMLTSMVWCAVACVQLALSTQDQVSTEAVEIQWRLTKFGWMDATTWATSWTEPARTIDFIHPTIFAGMIFLFTVWAMIWASSEWDVERLFSGDKSDANDPIILDSDSAQKKSAQNKSCGGDCVTCKCDVTEQNA